MERGPGVIYIWNLSSPLPPYVHDWIKKRCSFFFFFFLMSSVAEGKGERGLGRLMWVNSPLDNCLAMCFTLFVHIMFDFFLFLWNTKERMRIWCFGSNIWYLWLWANNFLFHWAQMVKNLPAMWETWVLSWSWEDPLEKGMATHSSILAWRIPRTEEPGGLTSWGHKELVMT